MVIVPLLMALASWCERQIVADDPWPFAEYPTHVLMQLAPGDCNKDILKELAFRGVVIPECEEN